MRPLALLTPPAFSIRAARVARNAALACLAASASFAEEGGSGHYLPGSMASFADSVAQKETFLVRYNGMNYEGSAGANRPLPIGGMTAVDADVSAWANGLTLFWRPPVEIGCDGRWSYAMSATIPYVSVEVSAYVSPTLPGGAQGPSVKLSDSIDGLGDIIIMPLMLNYNVNPDLNLNARLGVYAPTGSYEVGRLANAGKNYWSYEPDFALMYFGTENGREFSWFAGVTFNEENDATRYKSGSQFHTELTIAQHFPFAGGLAGVGLTGYYYEQLTGDSGSGARFGDFEAQTSGVGPVLSHVSKALGHDLVSELKWIHEFDSERRFEGDTVFLKVIYKLMP